MKKRIIVWATGIIFLLSFCLYTLIKTDLKIQEAEAACVGFALTSCHGSDSCDNCPSGYTRAGSKVYAGKGSHKDCKGNMYVVLCTRQF